MNKLMPLAEERSQENRNAVKKFSCLDVIPYRVRVSLCYLHFSKKSFGFYFEDVAVYIVAWWGRAQSSFAFRTVTSFSHHLNKGRRGEKRRGMADFRQRAETDAKKELWILLRPNNNASNLFSVKL